MPMSTREQQREYQRVWMQKRRKEAIQYLGGKCVVCGSTIDLEIDHIDPTIVLTLILLLMAYGCTVPFWSK